MIARITVGKKYSYQGRLCTVVELKKGRRGWIPDMVVIRYISSDPEKAITERHLAGHFRDDADYLDAKP